MIVTNRKKSQFYTGKMWSRWSMAIRQWLVHATFYKLDINWTVNWTDKRWMQELDDQPLQDLSRTEVVFAKPLDKPIQIWKMPEVLLQLPPEPAPAKFLTETGLHQTFQDLYFKTEPICFDSNWNLRCYKWIQMAQMVPVSLDVPVPADGGSAPR